MKRLNNSQPLAVAVQYSPLNTSIHLRVEGGLSTFQFYRQQLAQWSPDHSHPLAFDSNGAQIDGPLRLTPIWSVIDPDGVFDTSTLVPQVYWFVDSTPITSTDPSQDYYINGSSLFVRKNFTHLQGATVSCECRFTDTRNNSLFVLSDSIVLSSVLQADEQWMINILSDRTQKYYPLSAQSSIRTFEAEARLGSLDKTADVLWFWDYTIDQGAAWNDFKDEDPFYVSGKNSPTLVLDADCVDQIIVRARIAVTPGALAADLPNEATAALAWRIPSIRPYVYCVGGDKVLSTTENMTFGLHVHVPKHDDLTLEQQREWLMCDWILRRQGQSSQTFPPIRLGKFDVLADVSANQLRNNNDIKYIADPQCSLRGPFAVIQVSRNGKGIQTSSGDFIMART